MRRRPQLQAPWRVEWPLRHVTPRHGTSVIQIRWRCSPPLTDGLFDVPANSSTYRPCYRSPPHAHRATGQRFSMSTPVGVDHTPPDSSNASRAANGSGNTRATAPDIAPCAASYARHFEIWHIDVTMATGRGPLEVPPGRTANTRGSRRAAGCHADDAAGHRGCAAAP